MKPPIGKAVRLSLAQVGKPYVFAAEVSPSDPSPEAFDCSELVEWIDDRVGSGKMPDGSMNQRAYCMAKGTMIPVAKGLRTRGALLFRDVSVLGVGHVAISLGTSPPTSSEARGSAYGCGTFDARIESRLWTEAALWPGFDYSKPEPQIEMVGRYVVFGPYGGRWGHVTGNRDLNEDKQQRLAVIIAKAQRKFPNRPAIVLYREEPRDLEDLQDDYPKWLAKKHGRAA